MRLCSKESSLKILALLLMALFPLLLGCVGTVKDADAQKGKAAGSKGDGTLIEYEGIRRAVATSDRSAEIFFPQAAGVTDSLTYVVRYDGQQIPKYFPATSLRPDYRGLLKVTINDLMISTRYVFSVQLRDVKLGVESNNKASKAIQTFSNSTAIFDGVTELRHLTGSDGTRGLAVYWNAAKDSGGIIKQEYDPVSYEITVIDAGMLTPGSMNDPSEGEPARRVFRTDANQRSAIVSGLDPDSKYYIQVRCIHYGYSLNAADKNYKVEENTIYKEISTYSNDVSDIEFDNSSFRITFPSGSGGLYSLGFGWTPPKGNFDHYRIYYAINGEANINDYLNSQTVDNICNGPETNNAKIYCAYVPPDQSSKIISALKSNTKYDSVLAICTSTECASNRRITTGVKSGTTTPPVADFNGITTISPGKSLSELDRAYLHFELPNFLSGALDGYVVRYYFSDPSSPSYVQLNHLDIGDPVNDTGIDVLPYYPSSDTQLVLSGIDPSSSQLYCFMVVPFVYNIDGTKTYGDVSSFKPVCYSPTIQAPTQVDFSGIKVNNIDCDSARGRITISWNAPLKGVFSHYEVFYQNASNNFNFGDALQWETNAYNRHLLDSSYLSYTLMNLVPSTKYWVGVLTYYNSPSGPIRSEFNTNFIFCNL